MLLLRGAGRGLRGRGRGGHAEALQRVPLQPLRGDAPADADADADAGADGAAHGAARAAGRRGVALLDRGQAQARPRLGGGALPHLQRWWQLLRRGKPSTVGS